MACIQRCITRKVISLDESDSCADAALLMAESGIGSVGVLRGANLVGLVTERDLVTKVVGRRDPAATPLRELVPADLPAVTAQATEVECANLMRTRQTRHLAVRDASGEIVGVVSLLDLVELVVEDKQWTIDQLGSYVRGGRAQQLSEPLATIFTHGHP